MKSKKDKDFRLSSVRRRRLLASLAVVGDDERALKQKVRILVDRVISLQDQLEEMQYNYFELAVRAGIIKSDVY